MRAVSDWFAVVDTAQDPRLLGLVRTCRDHQCLFAGVLDPEIAASSPYLVRLDEREPLLATWRMHGAGRNWGVMIESELPSDALRRHLRRFLQAKLPDGATVLFRFYDPRVLPTYLASAPPEQIEGWFDGVRQFVAERADGTSHAFRWRRGALYDGEQPVVRTREAA
jgi:hypothetical protein